MEKRRARARHGWGKDAAAWGACSIGMASPMVIATAQQFAFAVEAAESIDELAHLLDAIAREMGGQYFALSHHVDVPRAPQPAIRIHNYPGGWEEFFDAERLGPSDPVHRASHLTNVGFAWSKLPQLIMLTRRDEEILAKSRRVGLADGLTVPAHIPGESAGSCSFATAHGRSLHSEWLPLAQFVGATAFEGARRLSGIRRIDPERPRISDRQRDCIYWAARGKSDWETSQILGIGHDTASQHMKEARKRYGVTNRTQLAIHALHDGVLTFTDALRR
ncbi:LuxR family transcriptional regulator [Sphingomonas psychrotolerans]|uniref:LuxR family transcriptional regulator n=1 Tax=Sphingomonas psychrotolerans TaxID=1327635 RepID=A0ABU3N7U5_9SPHN|nr:LuxR family transcriptional regulator [Sphingomonas psychrotolerans]MDT8760552.1 LuxR family transcriptional regulator [Sphingomonas psychrotolerans]